MADDTPVNPSPLDASPVNASPVDPSAANPPPVDPTAASAAADAANIDPTAMPENVTFEGAADVSANAAGSPDGTDTAAIDQAMIDELLKQASFDDPATAASGGAMAGDGGGDSPFGSAVPAEMPETERFNLPNFQQVIADAQVSSIELLRDVELNVKIELGRSRMLVEDVLKLAEGSVVELDKLAGDPVDVFVNDRLVARGEVLVLNENFCVRVNEIVAGVKDEGI